MDEYEIRLTIHGKENALKIVKYCIDVMHAQMYKNTQNQNKTRDAIKELQEMVEQINSDSKY